VSEPLLVLEAIDVGYGDVEVLRGVDLAVEAGEIVTLLGANGAGKTTTLRAITGLVAPRAGTVRFRGRSLADVPPHARAELGLALVPEGRELWPTLTVKDNLLLGAHCPRARPRAAANLARVLALFPRLAERSAQLAGSLSGGEQQMCAIGRALMSEPTLLLLDEPSLGLSPLLVDQVMRTVADLHRGGMTVLLVEQNLRKALEVAQRGLVIETGRVKLEGRSAALAADPGIRAAYLGL